MYERAKMRTDNFPKELLAKINGQDLIAIRLKIHTKSIDPSFCDWIM